VGSDSDDESDASNLCYMVQGDNPLEVNSESELDEDVDMSYDDLASFYQQLLEKYDLLKKNHKRLKNKYESISKEKDSFQNKLENISKENESLKKENISLFSKLNDICEGNNSLKNKINLVEKEKEIVLEENNSLKRKFVSKEKENISKKKKIVDSHAFHATIDKNEIHVLKNRIDCLSSTLSNCASNHSKLETLFQKKQAPHVHAHNPWHTYTHCTS